MKENITKNPETPKKKKPFFIRLNFWSTHPEIEKATLKLIDGYASAHSEKRGVQKKKYLTVAKVLILNLLKSHRLQQPLAYSRRDELYAINRYNPSKLKADTLCNLIDWMAEIPLIEHDKAKPSQAALKLKKNKKKKIRLNSSCLKIRSELWSFLVLEPDLEYPSHTHPNFDPVILREKDTNDSKKNIEYRETEVTTLIRQFLNSYNDFRSKIQTEHLGQPVTLGKVVRIFNHPEFNKGGRFYWGLEVSVKRESRATFKLSGSDTVELDYKCLYPSILYSRAGKQLNPEKDSYRVYEDDDSNEKYRSLVKVAFACILDCKTHHGTVSAIKRAIEKSIEDETPLAEHDNPNDLVRLIKEHNYFLNNYFGSKCSTELQYHDSRMAEAIIGIFMKENKPILCVHDSFIVRVEDKDFLESTMKAIYSKFNNGFTIAISTVNHSK